MTKPLQMNITSSADAPADSFSAVFAVTGEVPELYSVCVWDRTEILFFGTVDEQTEEKNASGIRLRIRARSLAAILLDNEAVPGRYCLPSLSLLFERHIRPLGFTELEGTPGVFSGELVISKGMSEWQVLKSFCEMHYGTTPYVTNDMVVHTGENKTTNTVFVDACHPTVRIVRRRSRSSVISDIYARTYRAGGYEMHFQNDFAQKHRIQRKRYVNTLESRKNSVLFTKELLPESNRKFDSYLIEKDGIVRCRVGDFVRADGISGRLRISELHYVLTGQGERTRIYGEAELSCG